VTDVHPHVSRVGWPHGCCKPEDQDTDQKQ
jgi:hypothetical protein